MICKKPSSSQWGVCLFWFVLILLLLFLFYLFFFYFTILYWFCHTSTCIHHGCTHAPHPESPSHLPPHNIPLGHPSAPAPSFMFWSLGQEDLLEEEMAPHSNIISKRIPWRMEPSRQQSMGLQRGRHNWASECTQTYLASNA